MNDPSELLVIAFDSVDKAEAALKSLQALNKEHLVQLKHAAVISRDAQGKFAIKAGKDLGETQTAVVGAFAGGLLGLASQHVKPVENMTAGHLNTAEVVGLGSLLGAGVGAGTAAIANRTVDLGFPEAYLKQIGESLTPGSSAIVSVVHFEHVDQIVSELSQFGGGRVLRQSLPADAAAQVGAAFGNA